MTRSRCSTPHRQVRQGERAADKDSGGQVARARQGGTQRGERAVEEKSGRDEEEMATGSSR
eukprot:4249112-Pleurochrysis_carterae.AAC.2